MNLQKQILRGLRVHANPKRAAHDIGYLKSSFPTLGCSIPALRTLTKSLFCKSLAHATDLHVQTRLQLHNLWRTTNTHEIMTICLLYFSLRKPDNTLADWRVLKSWASKIDNWAHSDALSDIYADILDRHRELYQTFNTWNNDKHPWKRRLSLTSLLYYSSMRSNPLPASKILPLIKPRINDEHFYVQRAIGWTLRECGNLYPAPTEAFIQKHLTQLSSIAFSTATEKWTTYDKMKACQKRRQARSSKSSRRSAAS